MDNSSEERLKIAVFIDFDNIAIGVKQSLSRNFDVGTVLEAIKEKGQVISKIAYGDWKRAEDYSRAMTQHAVQMVQRNLTPGGGQKRSGHRFGFGCFGDGLYPRSHQRFCHSRRG